MKHLMAVTLGVCAIGLVACDGDGANASGPAPAIDASGPGDDTVRFQERDAVMNAAVEAAQNSLPEFLDRLDAGDILPTDTLKVGFTVDGGYEHIWINQVARKGDQLSGVLVNEPNRVPGLHQGSPVTFSVDSVSDWAYQKDGKRWGGYTTRAMLPYLAPERAAEIRANLSDTPTETTAR